MKNGDWSFVTLQLKVQSRFAETRFAETLTLTLTLNPNFGKSSFGETGFGESGFVESGGHPIKRVGLYSPKCLIVLGPKCPETSDLKEKDKTSDLKVCFEVYG